MNRHAFVRRIHHWIVNRGVLGSLHEVVSRALLKLQGRSVPGRQNIERGAHPFDSAYGVETAGLVWGETLDESKAREGPEYWATGYYGVAPSVFTEALRRLKLEWSKYTFVDIGCGKGRALLIALRFPFRQVLGVELSPELAAVAQRNLQSFTAPWRCPNVAASVLVEDASKFAVPAGPLVLYLYHPFAAPVMKGFLAHLQASLHEHPREVILLYGNPELAGVIEKTKLFSQLWSTMIPLSEDDAQADRFGSKEEYFIAYRSSLTA